MAGLPLTEHPRMAEAFRLAANGAGPRMAVAFRLAARITCAVIPSPQLSSHSWVTLKRDLSIADDQPPTYEIMGYITSYGRVQCRIVPVCIMDSVCALPVPEGSVCGSACHTHHRTSPRSRLRIANSSDRMLPSGTCYGMAMIHFYVSECTRAE
jgi:hypothetical protein